MANKIRFWEKSLTVTEAAMGLGLLLGAHTILAQQAISPVRLAETAEPTTGLEEIVVTAQKRSESEVNVPISIATVSRDALVTLGIQDVTDLPSVVPGLRIDFSGAFSQPTIRGVGSAILGPGLSSNVATYVDGIIRPSSLTNNVQFDDVSNIQVLKGPQGTLFGRNATGGAIIISTQEPTFDTTIKANASYASYHTAKEGLFASTGFTDTLAGSISVTQAKSDGFVRNVFTNSDAGQYNDWGIRAKVLFRPSDTLQFLLSYEHLVANDNRATALNVYRGYSDGIFFPGAIIPTTRGTVANDFPSFATSKSDGVTLKSMFDFGWATLTSYTGGQWEHDHNSSDIDGSSAPVVGVFWPINDRTLSQEFDLTSQKSDSFNWVAGLYYFHNQSDWPNLEVSLGSVNGGAPFTSLENFVTTKSYAAFFDATKTITDKLFLTAGVRAGNDTVDARFQNNGGPLETPSHTWGSATPRLVLRYALDPQSNVYASFSEGYKSGVFNAPGSSTVPVAPEKINAYEIGYKTAHSRWRWDAAAYYYQYRGLQVDSYTSLGSVLTNAAKSRIYGLDTSFTGQLTDRFSATVSAAYTHARYTDFPTAAGYTFSPTTGVASVTENASGFQMQRSPTFSGDVILNYGIPLSYGKVDLAALYSFQSKVYFDAIEYAYQGAYGTLNLRIDWTDPSKHWTVGIFGKNVTNKVYISQVLPDSAYFGQQYGEPATVGVEVRAKY
jgi:iron complex outermembrane receptor protein